MISMSRPARRSMGTAGMNGPVALTSNPVVAGPHWANQVREQVWRDGYVPQRYWNAPGEFSVVDCSCLEQMTTLANRLKCLGKSNGPHPSCQPCLTERPLHCLADSAWRDCARRVVDVVDESRGPEQLTRGVRSLPGASSHRATKTCDLLVDQERPSSWSSHEGAVEGCWLGQWSLPMKRLRTLS